MALERVDTIKDGGGNSHVLRVYSYDPPGNGKNLIYSYTIDKESAPGLFRTIGNATIGDTYGSIDAAYNAGKKKIESMNALPNAAAATSSTDKPKDKQQTSEEANAATGAALQKDKTTAIDMTPPMSVDKAGEWAGSLGDKAGERSQAYKDDATEQQRLFHENAVRRARETAQRIRRNTGVNTQKTPEMLQSERYQRAADALNNATYWRQGVYGARTGQDVTPTGSGAEGAYQQNQIETEDMRQQALNRQRQAEKQQYEELGKMKAADDVFMKLDMGGALTENDLDKLRVINPMTIAQQIGVSAEALAQEMYRLPGDALKALSDAATRTGISIDKIYFYLKWRSMLGPQSAIQLAQALEIPIPSIQAMFAQGLTTLFDTALTPKDQQQ